MQQEGEVSFARKKPCADCPWKRRAAPGKFPPERYAALANTADPSFPSFPQPLFGCHMRLAGSEQACAGFLLVVGYDNINVRLAAGQERLNINEISTDEPLYSSYEEMALANGCDLRKVKDSDA